MIDVNKPMQFKGSLFHTHFKIEQVFKSVNPQRFIVEYSGRYSLEDSQVGMFIGRMAFCEDLKDQFIGPLKAPEV